MASLRLATFNVENLDVSPGEKPSLDDRIDVLKPTLRRLRADVLCLQEIHGQKRANDDPYGLSALDRLLKDTPYEEYHRWATYKNNNESEGVLYERNLVTLSRFPIKAAYQYKNDITSAPQWLPITETGSDSKVRPYTWERPILLTDIDLGNGQILHVINLHLKSKLPTKVKGQKEDRYTWTTAAGWAEGYYISSIKRVGQAIEVRTLLDRLLGENEQAWIALCGDLNADVNEVPVRAIRGEVEDTGNSKLIPFVMVPCERTIPQSKRFTLYHHGKPEMYDHILVSRTLIPSYRGTEVFNEMLHDESVAFAGDVKFPESDHAPVVAEFDLGTWTTEVVP